jgi:hypothetical protein
MVEGLIEKYQLEKFIETEKPDVTGDKKDITVLRKLITKKNRNLARKRENQLGIEKFAANQIEEEVSELENELEQKRRKVELSKIKYPEIDPSFLSMTHNKTLSVDARLARYFNWIIVEGEHARRSSFKITVPRFAVYSLDSPECKLYFASYFYKSEMKGKKLPNSANPKIIMGNSKCINFRDFLLDAVNIVGNVPEKDRIEMCFNIYSHFSGFIPQEIKDELKKHKKIFGKEIFLIAEAEWQVEPRPVPIGDPLIIGHKHGHYFLLDSFDCTPMEEYAKAEFTTEES